MYERLLIKGSKETKGVEIDGKDYYIVPWLSLYKGETATFILKLDIKEEPEELTFKYREDLFELNPPKITCKPKGKSDFNALTIKCIEEFDSNQNIDVLADGKRAGRLIAVANGKERRKKLNVLLVPVKTDVEGTGEGEKGNIEGEEGKLKKYLRQALINVNVAAMTDPLDLTGDANFKKGTNFVNGGGDIKIGLILDYMRKNYDPALRNNYPDYFIIYVFGLNSDTGNGGIAYMNSNYATAFKSRTSATLVHELMHCLGLKHTFVSASKFMFDKGSTENIMDYSPVCYTTWKWQWDIMATKNKLVTNEES